VGSRERWWDDDRVTTRTLVILRHAKAASPQELTDIDRPLTARGHADAAAAGAWLAQREYSPDLVLCSPARRARETWHGVAVAMRQAPEVRYDPKIYNASALELLHLVSDVEVDTATVLLVGHNPGLSQLSALLDPDGGEPGGLRTAGSAVHTSAATWIRWGPGEAALATTHTARADA
jgi:phosphohistidine phosphatase